MMLIVAGHHRSGTSLLAQLLAASGLFLGDELMPGAASNPHGHVEDMEVVRLHDRILADNGRNWQVTRDLLPVVNDDVWTDMADLIERRDRRHRLWGFKDPRVCLFLPLWKHLVPEAKLLLTFRHPGACVESIERREARNLIEGVLPAEQCRPFWTRPDHALKLWVTHNRALLRAVDAYPDDVMVTRFSDLGRNRDIVGELNRRWELGLAGVTPDHVFDPAAVTASEPPLTVRSTELAAEVGTIWEQLQRLANGERTEVMIQ